MARFRRVLVPFLAFTVLFISIVRLGHWFHQWSTEVRVDTLKPEYYHFEFIDIRVRARAPQLLQGSDGRPLKAVVLREGRPWTTIGGLTEVELHWDDSQGALIGHWPCPWNAPEGAYQLALVGPLAGEGWVKSESFRIVRRRPRPLPHRFVVMTMETARHFATMKVKRPDGTVGGWQALLDWVQFVGGDALWVMAGQSPGEQPGETWLTYNWPMFPLMAKECKRRGIHFGLYVQCYLTNSKERLARYRYAEELEEGKPVYTRSISLLDPNRPKDVADLLKAFKSIPGVDYVGLDYIRNALGGYELVDEFLREMSWIPRPNNWDKLTRDERMIWFARKKIARRDKPFIDAWQWWRAHRVGLIVQGIRREIGDDIGLWAFTLTWEKGWQHGQDPVMMNDAGVDADALMLYEADSEQFEGMMKEWPAYVHRKDVQLIAGDVVDWVLHQRSPRGPGEFQYRLEKAARGIYADGPADGIFFHDLNRALWGRLGPYSTMDWMRAAKSAVQLFRSLPSSPSSDPADAAQTLRSAPARSSNSPSEALR